VTTATAPVPTPLRIGASACLLGEAVRYDGGHKQCDLLTQSLAGFMTFIPVCPEVELGLPVPREPIRLELAGADTGSTQQAGIRLVAPGTGRDLTAEMAAFTEARAIELAELDLHGYVFKAHSPSCGLHHVPVQGARGRPAKNGQGKFAGALTKALPNLPVTQEDGLLKRATCEAFIAQAFAYRRLRRLFSDRWRMADLEAFQAREETLLWVHEPAAPAALAHIMNGPDRQHPASHTLATAYEHRFLSALTHTASTGRHVKVLHKTANALKPALGAENWAALNRAINNYRARAAPLAAPLSVIRKHFSEHESSGLARHMAEQSYFDLHPCELLPDQS